jgi:hypothetical protein
VGKVTSLPALPTFPSGTRFFDVEGVPVAEKPRGVCVAFDPAPRWFPSVSVDRNGTEVSLDAFSKLVDARKDAVASSQARQ